MDINIVHTGNCIDIMKSEIPDSSIDSIISDPPYGVSFSASEYYDDSIEHIKEKTDEWLSEMSRVLKEGSHIYIFVPTLEIDHWVSSCKKYFQFNNLLSTEVYGTGNYTPNNFGFELQLVIFASKGKAKRLNEVDWIPTSGSWQNDSRNPNPKPYTYKYPSVIPKEIARANNKNNKQRKGHHPNEKNVELISKFIEMSTEIGDLVLDPFAGSGSTLVAAQKSKRKFIGIELNKEFSDICRKRTELNADAGEISN